MPLTVNGEFDAQVRLAALQFLGDQQQVHGEVLPRTLLQEGFEFAGARVPLLGPRGIFKPAVLPDIPLSITTVPVVEGQPPPYEDSWDPRGFIRYRYRGTDPRHPDNVGLRRAMEEHAPLVYFFGIVRGRYLPAYPAYVQEDHPRELAFTVAVDEHLYEREQEPLTEDPAPRRAYITRLVRQRLHQTSFRERVLRAYREACAVCRLKHRELLDAAHILPDTDPRAEPVVSNGLSLCRLHHAAFDRHLMGVRPDLVIELRRDLLAEINGPMLVHGLQGFQGGKLIVPRSPALRPNEAFLEERYEQFRHAG